MSNFENNLAMFSAVAVLGLSVVLAGVSLLSYQRLRHKRALLIGLAFLAFAGKGVYLSNQAWEARGALEWLLPVSLLDLLALVLLYLALRLR